MAVFSEMTPTHDKLTPCACCAIPFPHGLLYGPECEACVERRLGLHLYCQAQTFSASPDMRRRYVDQDRKERQESWKRTLAVDLG